MNKFKITYKWLKGKNMTFSAFGLTNYSRGMYTESYEVFNYGIKGIFGLRIIKEWGSNL
jgi:hypothetical protein